jgi:hypothetical protein
VARMWRPSPRLHQRMIKTIANFFLGAQVHSEPRGNAAPQLAGALFVDTAD